MVLEVGARVATVLGAWLAVVGVALYARSAARVPKEDSTIFGLALVLVVAFFAAALTLEQVRALHLGA